MNSHINNKLRSFEKVKKTNEKKINDLKEVHSSNMKILNEIEDKILRKKTLEYDESYNVQFSSRLETIIDLEVNRIKEPIGFQTIDIHLVKGYKEYYDYEGYERINIGKIGFVIEEGFSCELKYIFIKEEYQNKGYGSHILKRLRGIINACYRKKKEITYIWTKIDVIKSIEGKEIERISNRIKYDKIEKLLLYNGYEKENDVYINKNYGYGYRAPRGEFEMLQENLEERYTRYLGKQDDKYAKELMDEIEHTSNIISSNKYGLGDIDERLEEIIRIKRVIENKWDEEEFKCYDNISAVENINRYINREDDFLELQEKDTLEIKIFKLYCKEWNLNTVSKTLYDMGYKTKYQTTGKERPYTPTEIGEIIDDNTQNLLMINTLRDFAKCLRQVS